jgi:hypothetical protein
LGKLAEKLKKKLQLGFLRTTIEEYQLWVSSQVKQRHQEEEWVMPELSYLVGKVEPERRSGP